ncbi:MAG: aminotransferase class I/II-fold pyridoxal phosphate-dependent enzyme, partial [Caldilineae bacterium]
PPLIEALVETARRDDSHGYAGYAGIPALREAIAAYYQRRFGVTLDPRTELLPLIGSKEGLANIHLAWLDPGDIALAPDPGYIVYHMGPLLANGVVHPFPLRPETGWLPDFDAIPPDVADRARLMWLNYPNNPTGAPAGLDFFARAIAFCRAHNILLCHDNPYCDVTFDGYRAVSPLQLPGAKEVVIEFNSLSKAYNMAGWRVGMAVGNPVAIAALAKIKTQIDTGHPLAVQRMAVAALTGDQAWLAERNAIYQQRRDLAVAALRRLGLNVSPPPATLYLWFPAPPGYSDVDFHRKLLTEAHVSIAPGSMYGQQGVGWMRLSIAVPTHRLEEAMSRLEKVNW